VSEIEGLVQALAQLPIANRLRKERCSVYSCAHHLSEIIALIWGFSFWDLELIWLLELGHWNLKQITTRKPQSGLSLGRRSRRGKVRARDSKQG